MNPTKRRRGETAYQMKDFSGSCEALWDRLAGAGLKPLEAAVVKSHGGERFRKRP